MWARRQLGKRVFFVTGPLLGTMCTNNSYFKNRLRHICYHHTLWRWR